MTGGIHHGLSHDPALYLSQKHLPTLPSNADERLVRDTIRLRDEDSTIVWPIRSFDRRNTYRTLQNRYYHQILYGCTNPGCETPTCLSRQRRVSKGPFRPYTMLSARALATHLASQSHPEKGLCPHEQVIAGQQLSPGIEPQLQKHKEPRKVQGRDESAPRISRQIHSLATGTGTKRLSVTIDRSNVHLVNGHTNPPNPISVHLNQEDDTECKQTSDLRKPITKDPKSFTQNLFDTAAMKLLHFARPLEAYLQWDQSNGELQQNHSSNENRDKNSATENAAPIDQHKEGADGYVQAGHIPERESDMSLKTTLAKDLFVLNATSTNDVPDDTQPNSRHPFADSENSNDLAEAMPQSHDDSSMDTTHRPQSLSHFNSDNIAALLDTMRLCHPKLYNDNLLRQEMGRKNIPPYYAQSFYRDEAEQFEKFLAYSAQSITYVLGNVEPLLKSFLNATCSTDTSRAVSVSEFPSIVQALLMLSFVDIHPSNIFPSLWVSAGKLYLPGIARFNTSSRYGRGSGTQPYLNHASPPARLELQERLSILETCHIAKIIFAALVASVPRCEADIWLAFRKLRASGKVVPASVIPESSNDHKMIGRLITIVDAFEDDMALSLTTRLLKSLAGRHYGTRIVRDEQDDELNHHDNPRTILRLIRYVTAENPTVIVTDSEAHPTLKNGILDKPNEIRIAQGMQTPLLNIVEWLRTIILKEWDGKPHILKCSAIGAALELLSEIFTTKCLLIEADVFHTPFLAERLDVMEMPVEWATSDVDGNSVHLLSYPFLFPPSTLISYFRAINYAAMYKAFERSVEAQNLAVRIYNTAAPTTIRLQDRLNVAQNTYLVLEIRRESVLVDAMNQIWRRQKREVMRPLKVQMGMDEGEEGVDHGGVQQEFLRVAVGEVLNPDYGAFITDPQTQMSWFHPCSLEPEYKFELLGLLTSLAIYNGLTLPFTFPRALYFKLLGLPVAGLEDIEDGWPQLAHGLKILRDWEGEDVEDVFMRPYVYSVDSFGITQDIDMDKMGKLRVQLEQRLGQQKLTDKGKSIQKDLASLSTDQERIARFGEEFWPSDHDALRDLVTTAGMPQASGSEPVMVTNANREQYIRDYIYYLTDATVCDSFGAFRRGFQTCLNPKSLTLFNPDQLKTLVEGLPDIDIDELQRITRYEGGFDEIHPTILTFWKVINSWRQERVRQLLEFVTASDRLPVGGMERLTFVIQKNGVGDARLPTSLTCFGRLLLPAYENEEVLREGLERAVENSKGFGTP